MSIKKGSTAIVDRYKGSQLVERVYKGSSLIFDAYTEITGSLPLTFSARVRQILRNYRIYGVSGGSGAECPNLFDKTAVTTGYVIGSDGEYYENAGGGYSELIDVSEGTYTLGGVSTAHDAYTLRVHGYDGNGDWVEQVYSESITSSTAASYSFTVPAGISGLRLSFLIINGQDPDVLALVRGGTYPSYCIPITIAAKNLYDKNAQDTDKGYVAKRRIVVSNGATYTSANNFISEYIPVEPNTVYTLDGIEVIAGGSVANPGCCFYDENKDFIATVGCGYSQKSTAWYADNKQVTSPEDAAYIRINISYDTADTAMLLRADHAPAAYIPHDIDYDLFIGSTKLGADEYLDYSDQKVYKRTENLFDTDATDADRGYRTARQFDSDGATSNKSGWYISEYISVEPSTNYCLIRRMTSPYTTGYACFYDINKSFIRSLSLSSEDFVTSSDEVYIRFDSPVSLKKETSLTATAERPSSYIPYLQPTDPPSPFPAIAAYEGENTLSSTESIETAMVKGRIAEVQSG